MLLLKQQDGSVLEPSCGDGAFVKFLKNCVCIEIDEKFQAENVLTIDFFDFPTDNKFDTIIGNPPYVRFQDIPKNTKEKLSLELFDARSNLYLFFIEKSIKHLKDNGELIFITPRDFLKATSSVKLNKFIFEQGTITHFIDLGDKKIFPGFSPNCVIFRFEKGNFSRKTKFSTGEEKDFVFSNGQLLFTENTYNIHFSDVFFVKVGAVSGKDDIFFSEEFGETDFVTSTTFKTQKTEKAIFNKYHTQLVKHKEVLLSRKIRKINEKKWWQWGRLHYLSEEKRVYVNCKTRNTSPFFLNPCNNYDGSILAIFPRKQNNDLQEICAELNKVSWVELGFICDGRYIFSQRSLQNSLLPNSFSKFI